VGSHGVDLIRRLGKGVRRVPAAYWGMTVAHLGFSVALLGVALTSQLSTERDLRMASGERMSLDGVAFEFLGISNVKGPNYVAQRGTFGVTENGDTFVMQPEKRSYRSNGSMMTEAAIDAGLFRDIYVSLGEPLGNGDWAVRVQIKPFVRWIWLGGLLMAFGGALAVTDARYRRLRQRLRSRIAAEAV
jgi:cytochrome c-type biogenesis protein CcmF